MKLILAFVLLLPTLFEAWTDRHGESKEGKTSDALWLGFVALLLSVGLWLLLSVQPLKTIALLLGWRLLVFDYLTHALLIRNDVIVGSWYNYTGKTSKWDKIISKVNWKVRLAVRTILFALSLWWFLA